MTKKTAPAVTAPIKSQLEMMSGKVATVAPQSAVARLVHGEIKGGEAKQAFILSVIRDAILQAFKGNSRDIPEAMKLCEGKAVKAKAFYNGFTAIAGTVAKVEYKGKFDSADNAAIRAEVMIKTEAATLAFQSAYLETFTKAKEDAQKKRDEKKASASAASNGTGTDETGADTSDKPAMVADAVVVDVAQALDAVVDAIRAGLLDAAEMTLIRAALAAYDDSEEEAIIDARIAEQVAESRRIQRESLAA